MHGPGCAATQRLCVCVCLHVRERATVCGQCVHVSMAPVSVLYVRVCIYVRQYVTVCFQYACVWYARA